ncbi:MAG: hypothetical protein WAX14_12525 [Rhodococcus sp. (in: high G+C Gram-positive bacteria)]|uniref:hypothetical protein n=1 Tax=Rhodococcus sp. TaxID=1831 RepID=UPI003BB5D880
MGILVDSVRNCLAQEPPNDNEVRISKLLGLDEPVDWHGQTEDERRMAELLARFDVISPSNADGARSHYDNTRGLVIIARDAAGNAVKPVTLGDDANRPYQPYSRRADLVKMLRDHHYNTQNLIAWCVKMMALEDQYTQLDVPKFPKSRRERALMRREQIAAEWRACSEQKRLWADKYERPIDLGIYPRADRYSHPDVIARIACLVEDTRAHSVTEAINLYEEELRHERIRADARRARSEARANAALVSNAIFFRT